MPGPTFKVSTGSESKTVDLKSGASLRILFPNASYFFLISSLLSKTIWYFPTPGMLFFDFTTSSMKLFLGFFDTSSKLIFL